MPAARLRQVGFSVVVVVASAVDAFGQTINGSITPAEYGPALATQTNGTGFGDDQNELNQLFATYQAGIGLSVGLSGNLQQGSDNGLVLFIDSKPGGAVTSPGGYGVIGSIGGRTTDDWGTDTDGSAGVSATPGGGSILVPGFNPDYAIELNANSGDGSYFVNVIDLSLINDPPTNPLDPDNRDIFLGSNAVNGPAVTQTCYRDAPPVASGDITHAFDNTNTAGVGDIGNLGDPTSATTGFEFLFSDQFLGLGQGDVKLLAFITNGSGNFLSNQFLPGLPQGYGNLGGAETGAPMYDASTTPDAAVATVPVPEPAVTGCVLTVLSCFQCTRRRRTC